MTGMFDILYETCPWHTRVALFDERGKLISLRFEDESRQHIEGALVHGRVRRISEGLGAAFVDVGDTVDGFLPLKTLAKEAPKLTEGQDLLVRVVRGASDDKGARLDARVAYKEDEALPAAPSMVRPALSAFKRALHDAGDTPVRCWLGSPELRDNLGLGVPDEKIFILSEHPDVDLVETLDSQLEQLTGREFQLMGGGRLVVEMTKALVSIDVDAGAAGADPGQSALDINLQAATEAERLCQLLDLGGNVIIDFITMPKKAQREQVTEHLRRMFATRDEQQVEVLPMSRYGLVEVNRQRGGPMLPELLSYPSYVAGDILLRLWRSRYSTTSSNKRDIRLQTSEEVGQLLAQRLTTDVALAYFGRPVALSTEATWPTTRWQLSL